MKFIFVLFLLSLSYLGYSYAAHTDVNTNPRVITPYQKLLLSELSESGFFQPTRKDVFPDGGGNHSGKSYEECRHDTCAHISDILEVELAECILRCMKGL